MVFSILVALLSVGLSERVFDEDSARFFAIELLADDDGEVETVGIGNETQGNN